MDLHGGYFDSSRGYTLAAIALIIQQSREFEAKSSRVRHRAVRDWLREIGIEPDKYRLGRTAVIPGRVILLGLERRGMEEFDEDD